MTIINIGGKDHTLHFGALFSRALSKEYAMKKSMGDIEMEFGLGVRMVIPKLEMGDVDAIINVIRHGLYKYKEKPSEEDMIEAIEKIAVESEDGFDGVADLLLDGLKESGFYRKIFKEMDQEMSKAEKKQDKK